MVLIFQTAIMGPQVPVAEGSRGRLGSVTHSVHSVSHTVTAKPLNHALNLTAHSAFWSHLRFKLCVLKRSTTELAFILYFSEAPISTVIIWVQITWQKKYGSSTLWWCWSFSSFFPPEFHIETPSLIHSLLYLHGRAAHYMRRKTHTHHQHICTSVFNVHMSMCEKKTNCPLFSERGRPTTLVQKHI